MEGGRIRLLPGAKRLMRDFAAIIALTEKAVFPKLSSTTSRFLSSQVRY
jgi:hypothetical protein